MSNNTATTPPNIGNKGIYRVCDDCKAKSFLDLAVKTNDVIYCIHKYNEELEKERKKRLSKQKPSFVV